MAQEGLRREIPLETQRDLLGFRDMVSGFVKDIPESARGPFVKALKGMMGNMFKGYMQDEGHQPGPETATPSERETHPTNSALLLAV